MGRLDKYLLTTHDERRITITADRSPDLICDILNIISERSARLRSIDTRDSDEGDTQVIQVRLRVGRNFDEVALASDLASSRHVISYSWE
jgi:(p)ppGpp synthase/HD superfamily hydrolase